MDTGLEIFKNDEFGQVRTMVIDDVPFFIGKDIAEALGYKNASKAVMVHVDEEDKRKVMLQADSQNGKVVTETTLINESGLYSLVLLSKLPSAKKFKRWVTSEVLPAIRRHGVYAVDEVLADPDVLIGALVQLKAEREKTLRLKEEVAQKAQIISELSPKASYYDLILQNKSVVPITLIAKDYGMSAKRLNALLKENGIQFKQGKTWILYQKYASLGLTQSRTHAIDAEKSVMHTYWTQKGRLFLYDFLKGIGILPVIEREEAA